MGISELAQKLIDREDVGIATWDDQEEVERKMRNEAKGIRKAFSEAEHRFHMINNDIAQMVADQYSEGLERAIEMRAVYKKDLSRLSGDYYDIKQAISKAKHYLD